MPQNGRFCLFSYLHCFLLAWPHFLSTHRPKSADKPACISLGYHHIAFSKINSKCAWDEIHQVEWISLSKEDFAKEIAHKFPKIWRVHPFREGNTRTVVMLMTFFVEHYGYYFDQELLAQSAEYVRDALVMACLDNYSEYEYLERILQDAICTEPIAETVAEEQPASISEKYQKYQSKHYEPTPHEYVEYKTKNTYSKDPIAGKA